MKQPPKECVKEVIEVYGNFEGVSKNFRGVLGKFHGCQIRISRVFQECFTGDSMGVSRGLQGSSIEVSRKFQENVKVFNRSLKPL